MGSSGGATFNRGINRVAGTPKGSYRSPGNTFNVDIEYIWVLAVTLHLIDAFIEVKAHQEVATDLRVTYFNVDIEYIWVVVVALHLIEALIEVKVPAKRGSYRSQCNTFNEDIENIWVVVMALHLIEALIEVKYTKR